MKYAVKAFVESRQEKNGLFLIDMPTGSGKTHGAIDIMEEYIKGKAFNDTPRMFYITPLIKNIDEVIDKLKGRFKDDLELFNNSILKLPANYESVVDHLEEVKDLITPTLKRKDSYSALLSQVSLYNNLKKDKYPEGNLTSILNEIRTTYEPAFRLDLKNELNDNLKTEKERLSRLNQNEYSWVKILYPSCLTKERKVLFMTVSKFVSVNDSIINKPYRFASNSVVDKALIFIDEFDATKDVVLNQDIENCCDFKIDLYNMFFSIASSLRSRKFEKSFFGGSLDESDNKSSLSSFNKMKKVVTDAFESFNLMYSFKLDKQEDEDRYFLFDDFTLHTISTGKNKKIYVKTSEEESQNIIKFEDKDKDLTSFYSMISTIKGATTYFLNCCAMLARNYLNYHNDLAIKNKQELMEIDQAVSSILDPFNLDSNVAKTVSRIIINDYSLHNSNRKKDTLDTDFYVNGFRYYDFKDDMSHDTSTKISMCYLDNTPEGFLLALTNRSMVVGLSATASIDTVTGNYNLAYLKDQLKDSFYLMPDNDRERINANINKRIKHDKAIDVKTISTFCDSSREFAESVFENRTNADLFKRILDTAIIPTASDEKNRLFEYGRFTKVIQAIKLFLLNSNSKAMLVLTNKNIKKDNDLFSIETVEALLMLLKKELHLSYMPLVHKLYGSDFESEKEAYKKELKAGKKVILFSSYPSVGSGQNLQYTIDDGTNSKEKDVDSLYLEYPTHILVRLDKNSIEEDLIKYIYQMETMRVRGDVTPYVSSKNIKNAFRSFMKRQPVFNGQDNSTYGSTSVNNNILKILIQAVGRICRTDRENRSDVNIYVDDVIFDKVNFKYLKEEKRILNPEFEALINQSTKEFTCDPQFISFLNRTLEQDDRINSKITNVLSVNRKSWNSENMENWKAVREIVIKYPTISTEQLEEVAKEYGVISVKDFYSHFPNESKYNKYYYSLNERDEKSIHLQPGSGHIELSSNTSRLDLFMKSTYLRKHFIKNGYATKFEYNENIILPTVFQNIYKGILGEEVGKYIFEYNNLELVDIVDEDKFEKFDFQLKADKDIYIDFKNWSKSTEFNKDDEINRIKNKLQKVNGKKAIIVNMYFEDTDFYVHSYDDVITVSGLFKMDGDNFIYLTKEEFSKIRNAIFGGKSYGNN